MPLDPLQPDWSALAPLAGLGPIERTATGFRAATEAGPLAVAAFAPGIVRLTLGELSGPDFGILVAGPQPPPGVEVERREDGVELRAGDLCLALRPGPLRLTLARRGQVLLQSTTDGTFGEQLRLPPFARTSRGWLAALALESDDAVFGHGEKFGPLNHRGQLVRSAVEDALGVNAEASYKNTPFAWSPRGWGLFVHTAATVTHGVGHPPWSHRSYVLELDDRALDLFLIAGDDPAALIERYTWLTGRPGHPPRWSLGAWFSRAYYQDADEVLETARKLRARSIPVDVILLDGQAWQDNVTRFEFRFDRGRYPDPKAFLAELHALNFKVCLWEYPMISRRGPLFAELEAKGWLLKDPATGRAVVHDWGDASLDPLSPLQPSGLIDFTHPEAYAWWQEGHARLFELGVDVFKTDFGEQVPANAVGHAADGEKLHNLYPLLYQRCVFEATTRARGAGFIFARAGWAGSQRFPTHWGGDPQADWQALAASLRGGLSFGLSGGACYATDVGGFLGPPEPELYVRWAQAAIFASHLRFHGTSAREPWAFGDQAEAVVRRWLELRYRLIPYLESCLKEAASTGLPVMRAMALAFPDQPEAWAFDTQFMFGPALLVAPILRPGGQVRLYLPHGRWRDFVSGELFDGGRSLELRYALNRFPVFARAEVEIPLGPAAQHTG